MNFREYLESLGIKDNQFIGRFTEVKDKNFGYLNDILSNDGKLLLHPKTGQRQSIRIPMNFISEGFKNNRYYSFGLQFAPNEIRNKTGNEFLCNIGRNPRVQLLDYNPFRRLVESRYERLNNPDANKIISNLLREVGKGMYSSKKRMIFELLQNADDVPAGEDVKFYIETHNEYMLIAHDGLPFNGDDVKSITSAAESTKQKKKKRTGYKGIGFKSVFTDSTQVIIKSGGFLFEFNKVYEAFDSFDSFYFNRKKYRKYPGLLDDEKLQFADAKSSYKGIRDIPWQLLPIWKDSIPHSLRESNFTRNNNVGIALRLGAQKVREYLDEITSLALGGKFILFLRNTSLFRCDAENITVSKIEDKDSGKVLIRINKNSVREEFDYNVKSYDDIFVQNEAFENFGIDLKKGKKEIETGDEIYFLTDSSGKEIETIPPKIASFDQTTISFAAPVIKGILQFEESFKKKELNYSCFFTYLPMRENRIRLPFLVNADFIPSSNREQIQGDNPWNEYLFGNIGYKLVEWIAGHAKEKNPSYLSLLPPSIIEYEETDIKHLADKFNEYYNKALLEVPFVLNDQNEVSLKSEIIIDDTGVSQILGHRFFYDIFPTEKRLIHKKINSDILSNDLFDLEHIKIYDLIKKLNSPEGRKLLETYIHKLDFKTYIEYLKWLNKILKTPEIGIELRPVLNLLSFIRFEKDQQKTHVSWSNLKKDNGDLFLLTNKVEDYSDILEELGFNISLINIDDFLNIRMYLEKEETYLMKNTSLFDTIKVKCPKNNLSINQKIRLYQFFTNLASIGPVKCRSELYLFKNCSGGIKPLDKLIDTSVAVEGWLQSFKIDNTEGHALKKIQEFACKKECIYSQIIADAEILISIKQSITSVNISSFYRGVIEFYEADVSENKVSLNGEDIIFISDESGFKKIAEVYYSESLNSELHKNNYSHIKTCIESLTGLVLPHKTALSFIAQMGFISNPINISESIKHSCELDLSDIKPFLEYLVDGGTKEKLFEKGYFSSESNKLKFHFSSGHFQYFTIEKELLKYLDELNNNSFKLLPTELSGVGKLHELGLLIEGSLEIAMIKNLEFDISFIQLVKDKVSIRANWLNEIPRLNLFSKKEYERGSNEDEIMRLAIHLSKDEQYKVLIENFRKKIFIDGLPLIELAVKDKIPVKYEEAFYNFSLADLLPEKYEGKSNILEDVISGFSGLERSELERNIFIVKQQDIREILEGLKNKKISKASQFAFIKLTSKNHPISVNLFTFDVVKFAFNESIKYGNKYPPFKLLRNHINGFTPEKWVYPQSISFLSEELPNQYKEWIELEDKDAKVTFLEQYNFNSQNSFVGQLRLFFLNQESDYSKVSIALANLKQQPDFLKNTLLWLIEQKTININSENKINIISQIYNSIPIDTNIPVPVVISENNETTEYQLHKIPLGSKLYKLSSIEEKFKIRIKAKIFQEQDYFLIDDTLPITWKTGLGVLDVTINSEINTSLLEQANPYVDDVYQSWKHKDKYPIYILDNGIPHVFKFEDLELEKYEKGNSIKFEEKIYINRAYLGSLNELLKEYVSAADLVDFLLQNQQDKESEKNKDSLSEEELAAFQRIFGENAPTEYWKDLNLVSMIKGLAHLQSEGYDVAEAEQNLPSTHHRSYLNPVKKDGQSFKVLCKSAGRGLLYLKAISWSLLDNPDQLIYIQVGKRGKLCKTKKEILDKYADYFVFRMEGKPESGILDNALLGNFDSQKMHIIIRMKNNSGYDSLFERRTKKVKENSYENVLTGNENEI